MKTRTPTAVIASAALALSLASPAPAQAGILSWLIAGAGTACAASERCAMRAHAAREAVAAKAHAGCAQSLGCQKLARDAGDLRAHMAQGGQGLLARLLGRRAAPGVVANPLSDGSQVYGYAKR